MEIDGLGVIGQELVSLVNSIHLSTAYGMKKSRAEKTMIMTSKAEGFKANVKINEKHLNLVNNFNYLGSIVTVESLKKDKRKQHQC